MNTHFVEIVDKGTGEVVKRMGPMTERACLKVKRGASVNLNHQQYQLRVVESDGAK